MFFTKKKIELNIPVSEAQEHTLRTAKTPDLWRLEKYRKQLLFVYDEMMSDHSKNSMLNSEPVCVGFTASRYSLFKKRGENSTGGWDGRNTVAVAIQNKYFNIPHERIRGELYLIRPNLFIDLDNYKENGVVFYRKRVTILIPHRVVLQQIKEENGTRWSMFAQVPRITPIQAWIYLGKKEYFQSVLDGGFKYKPVRVYKTNNKWFDRCYYFTHKEYKKE